MLDARKKKKKWWKHNGNVSQDALLIFPTPEENVATECKEPTARACPAEYLIPIAKETIKVRLLIINQLGVKLFPKTA